MILPLGICCKEQSGDCTHMINVFHDIKDISYSHYLYKVENSYFKLQIF